MLQANSLKYKCRCPPQSCFYLSSLIHNPTLSLFISGFKLKFDPSSQSVPSAGKPWTYSSSLPCAHKCTDTRLISDCFPLQRGGSQLSRLPVAPPPPFPSLISGPRHLTKPGKRELTGRVLADQPFRLCFDVSNGFFNLNVSPGFIASNPVVK